MAKSIRSTMKKRWRAEKRKGFGAKQDSAMMRCAQGNLATVLGKAKGVAKVGVKLSGAGMFAPDGDHNKGRFAFRKTAAHSDDVVLGRPAEKYAPVGVITGATRMPEPIAAATPRRPRTRSISRMDDEPGTK